MWYINENTFFPECLMSADNDQSVKNGFIALKVWLLSSFVSLYQVSMSTSVMYWIEQNVMTFFSCMCRLRPCSCWRWRNESHDWVDETFRLHLQLKMVRWNLHHFVPEQERSVWRQNSTIAVDDLLPGIHRQVSKKPVTTTETNNIQ